MVKKLKKKYLPSNYRQKVFLKLHEFKHESCVAEYIAEFDNLLIKADVHEPEEQTITRFLGKLRAEIRNMVQLQSYTTFLNVLKLALRVEKILKESRVARFGDKDFSKGLASKAPFVLKSKVEDKGKGKKEVEGREKSKLMKERMCFKCHGFGHITSDCPNRKIITLLEGDDDVSDEKSWKIKK